MDEQRRREAIDAAAQADATVRRGLALGYDMEARARAVLGGIVHAFLTERTSGSARVVEGSQLVMEPRGSPDARALAWHRIVNRAVKQWNETWLRLEMAGAWRVTADGTKRTMIVVWYEDDLGSQGAVLFDAETEPKGITDDNA